MQIRPRTCCRRGRCCGDEITQCVGSMCVVILILLTSSNERTGSATAHAIDVAGTLQLPISSRALTLRDIPTQIAGNSCTNTAVCCMGVHSLRARAIWRAQIPGVRTFVTTHSCHNMCRTAATHPFATH